MRTDLFPILIEHLDATPFDDRLLGYPQDWLENTTTSAEQVKESCILLGELGYRGFYLHNIPQILDETPNTIRRRFEDAHQIWSEQEVIDCPEILTMELYRAHQGIEALMELGYSHKEARGRITLIRTIDPEDIKGSFQNHIGDGEKPIINTADAKPFMTADDLQPFLQRDGQEIEHLKGQGIEPEHLTRFMSYLIGRGYHAEDGDLIDGMFRMAFSRAKIERTRQDWYDWGFGDCPFTACTEKIQPNRDLLYDADRNLVNWDSPERNKGAVKHPSLRLNDIAVHLADKHGLYEKGDIIPGDDQVYPRSPIEFAHDFFIPWKAKTEDWFVRLDLATAHEDHLNAYCRAKERY